jgi:hypothetical protein
MIQGSPDRMKSVGLAVIVFATTLGVIAATLPDTRALGGSHQDWVQPDAVARWSPMPISSREWEFNYQPVEALVQTLVIGSDSDLELNRHTAEVLGRIASALPGNLTQADIERIGFLSRQGFPGSAISEVVSNVADDVANTLMGFLRYQQAARAQEQTARNGSGLTTAQLRFERSVALQNQYLGKAEARQLFGQQRRLQQYLIERQTIQANVDLSAAQRQEALDHVSEQFRSGPELESGP